MELLEEHRCFEGRQQRWRHDSTVLNCTMTFSIFLPPTKTTTPPPVLYWLSGLTCDELPALIQSQFTVSERCAISGHSMGGHGALIMALKNPGRFTSVSAFAPIVNPAQVPWGQKAFSAYLGNDISTWQAWDSCALMLASQNKDAIPTLIDQGDADQFLAEQLQPARLAEADRQTGWPLTLRVQPGYDHSYYFMASFIEDHLRFHAQYLLK